jgi:hypothetical protein
MKFPRTPYSASKGELVERAAWFGKCEAQRQVSDYQLGVAMTGTNGKNPYELTTREWFAYEAAFSDFVNMAFERE